MAQPLWYSYQVRSKSWNSIHFTHFTCYNFKIIVYGPSLGGLCHKQWHTHTLCKCHSSNPLSYTVQNLFFTAPTPIASTDDLRSFCTGLLPQLPTFTVTPVTTPGSHGYCDYQSARGSFRSPSFAFTDGDTGKPLYCVLFRKFTLKQKHYNDTV